MAQKVGMREKLAQKVGRREIYPPVPPPQKRAILHFETTVPQNTLLFNSNRQFFYSNAQSFRSDLLFNRRDIRSFVLITLFITSIQWQWYYTIFSRKDSISVRMSIPGGGGLRYETDGEILNLTPKGDHLGVAQGFCDP